MSCLISKRKIRSKPMIKTLFSLQTATKVFEKLTTIRRPWSYDMDMREGRTR
jgi:hypothetical protein